MKQPLTHVSWALLLLALGTLIYTAWIVGFTLQHPSDGVSVSLDDKGLRVNTAPLGSGLYPDDIVTHIGGKSVVGALQKPGLRSLASHVQALLYPSPSEEGYTILRENRAVGVRVPSQVPTLQQVLSRLGILSIIGGVFVICAIFILLSRTGEPAAPLITLAFCLEGLNLVNNVWTSMGANVFIRAAWLFIPVDLLTFTLVMSLVLHVFLIFPEPKWLVRRSPISVRLIHGLNILIALAAMVGVGSPSRLHAYNTLYRTVLYPLGALELSLALVHLAHTYTTTHRPGVRNQIRWLMWGMVFGTLPWLLFYSLPIALLDSALLPFELTTIALALVPIAFVFSVTHYGLMAVDMLINHSLVYAGLSGLLVGIYLIAIGLLESVLHILFGPTDTGGVSTILAVILVALIANPLRAALQRLVDRAFYRRRLDLRQLVPEVGDRLSTILYLDTLVTLLTEEIPRRLQIKRAVLLLRQEDGTWQASPADVPDLAKRIEEVLPATQPETGTDYETTHVWAAKLEIGAPIVLSHPTERPTPSADTKAMPTDWEVLLPLRSRGKVQGLYALGPRLSGDLYDHEEIATLSILAHQIALTLENIQLYQQVEHYTHDLESLVMARTHELQTANQDLGRERDRLAIILQQMADGLLVTDPDGVILMSNAVFQTMVQRSAETLTGEALQNVPACGCLRALIEQVQTETPPLAPSKAGEPLSANCEVYGRVLRASSAALSNGGGVVTVLRDITRERRIDQMKTEFISAVSHELRTPLTSVLGFARLINKVFDKDIMPLIPAGETKGDKSVRARRAAQRIHKNLDIITIEAERLTRLINDVLDIAKLEAGDLEWHTREFPLLPLLQRVVATAQPAAEEKGLILEGHFPPTLPTLEADPERIAQVLDNLLSNAIKFTDTGTITVTAQLFRNPSDLMTQVGWSPPDDSVGGVLISVADTGIGVTEIELPYLFQRFYQIRGDTLIDKPKGTGLGLAISKSILMHYGGTIWANSTPGVGSTFSFVLPLNDLTPAHKADTHPLVSRQHPVDYWNAPALPPTVRESDESTAQGHSDLILVVDDEPAIRTLLAQTLGDYGYRTLEVANGVAGLRVARRQHPAAIVLDLMLPDISGFDVAQLLKADPGTASIPIVILSILENRERAAALGIEAYLTKPVQSAVLLRTLAEVMNAAQTQESHGA